MLAVAGVAVLVFAWQVRAWETRLQDDDLRFQAAPAKEGLWRSPSGPGADLARRLLAVDDDIRFRSAAQQFVRVHLSARSYAEEAERLSEFGQAQSTLEDLGAARSIADTPLARREPARDPAVGERRIGAGERAAPSAPERRLVPSRDPRGTERRREDQPGGAPGRCSSRPASVAATRLPSPGREPREGRGSRRREAGTDAGRLADARGGARRSGRCRARRRVAPRRAARAARAARPSPRAADWRHLVGSRGNRRRAGARGRGRSAAGPCDRRRTGKGARRGGVRRPRHVGVDARRAADAVQPCELPRPSGSRTRSRARRSASRR